MTSISRIHVWLALTVFVTLIGINVEARGFPFGLFAFPQTRRGRSSKVLTTNDDSANKVLSLGNNNADDPTSAILDSITISKNANEEDDIIQKLVDSLVKDAMLNRRSQVPEEQPRNSQGLFKSHIFQNNGKPQLPPMNYANSPAMPRNVDAMSQFGSNIQKGLLQNTDHLPQLANRQLLNDAAPAVMNLARDEAFKRQTDGTEVDTSSNDAEDNTPVASNDDEIRCIPKVMQVEETVYDRAIKCHHSYQEKCHMTYITDYRSTTQEKCETTFKKNCHITFKPMPFNESVNICHTPIVRKCGDKAVGPDICSTHYETNCETKYKTYEVEQDEPQCRMELMRKCKDVTIELPTADPATPRGQRQFEGLDASSSDTSSSDAGDNSSADNTSDGSGDVGNTIKVDENCEEWPVQKCILVKKTVRKVHPETECRKIPREVCVPNHCAMQQGEQICRDEVRMQVQNVPQEECELQPEENCHAEAVLVPRLVPKPNCIKVPKEICVNTKHNPRRVKKPVVKEWCYRPSDLLDNSPSISHQTPDVSGNDASGFFARRNKFFNF